MWLRAAIATVAGSTLVAASPTGESRPARVVLMVRPPVVRLGQSATISVRSSARWIDPKVRLIGSTTEIGLLEPWFPLQRHGSIWSVRIPPLEMRGVYPVELSEGPGSGLVRTGRWLVRVFAPGTLARRSFSTPEDVARDWVRTRGTLRALRRWPLSFHDLRLHALHQRLVASYTPLGDPDPTDRVGVFITAVRISFGAPWRLLEASTRP